MEFGRENYETSLRLFERAVKKEPANLMALTDAARAFGQRFEIEQALRCLEQMRKLAPGDAGVAFLVGQTYRMIFRTRQALKWIRKAAEAEVHADALLEAAVLLERQHSLEEALEQLDRCLHKGGNRLEANLLKGRILRRLGKPSEAVEIWRAISEETSVPRFLRGQALNEWGHLLDAEEEYEGAFEKFVASKEMLLSLQETQSSNKKSEFEKAHFREFGNSLTKELLQDWAEEGERGPARSMLLTGCPRSGTTLIEKILDGHPDVVTADEFGAFTNFVFPRLIQKIRDEKGFFRAQDLADVSKARLNGEASRYQRYLEAAMAEPVGDRFLVDKNPSMTFIAAGTLRLWPQNRILYALRDPRDVALSCFFRWLPVNSVSVRFLSLEETARRTAEEFESWLALRDLLPSGRWLETRYENTIDNYTLEAKGILDWMGLPWTPEVESYREHSRQRGVNSPTYEVVDQPISQQRLARWHNYERQISKVSPILAKSLEDFDYSA